MFDSINLKLLFHGVRSLRSATKRSKRQCKCLILQVYWSRFESLTRIIKRTSEKNTRTTSLAGNCDKKFTVLYREHKIQRAKKTLFKIGELK